MSLIELANAPRGPRALTHACRERRIERAVPPVASGRNRTREVISPELMGRWLSRPHGQVSFHLTLSCWRLTVALTAIRTGSTVCRYPCGYTVERLARVEWGGQRIPYIRAPHGIRGWPRSICPPDRDLWPTRFHSRHFVISGRVLVGGRGLRWDHCQVQGGGWSRTRQ